jgi:hypothetical protein
MDAEAEQAMAEQTDHVTIRHVAGPVVVILLILMVLGSVGPAKESSVAVVLATSSALIGAAILFTKRLPGHVAVAAPAQQQQYTAGSFWNQHAHTDLVGVYPRTGIPARPGERDEWRRAYPRLERALVDLRFVRKFDAPAYDQLWALVDRFMVLYYRALAADGPLSRMQPASVNDGAWSRHYLPILKDAVAEIHQMGHVIRAFALPLHFKRPHLSRYAPTDAFLGSRMGIVLDELRDKLRIVAARGNDPSVGSGGPNAYEYLVDAPDPVDPMGRASRVPM